MTIAALNRNRSLRTKNVLFILDGLDEIPDSEESAARTLFELLPVGSAGIRFLVSGVRAAKCAKEKKLKDVGEFSVTGFTQDEAARYLADLMPPADSAKLFPLSRGNPGYYSGVRRIIDKEGKLPDQIPATSELVSRRSEGGEGNEGLLRFLRSFARSIPAFISSGTTNPCVRRRDSVAAGVDSSLRSE